MPRTPREDDDLGYLRTTAAARCRQLRAMPFAELAAAPPVAVEEYEHRGHLIVLATAIAAEEDEAVVLTRAASVAAGRYVFTHHAFVASRAGRWAWPADKHHEALERLAGLIEDARPLGRSAGRVLPGSRYAGRKQGFGVGIID